MATHKFGRSGRARSSTRKLSWLFVVPLALLAGTSWAAKPTPDFALQPISEADVPLEGSQCGFAEGKAEILRSDGIDRLWIKVDGKLIEFKLVGDPEDSSHPSEDPTGLGYRWTPTFKSDWGSITLDVRTTAVGEADTTERKGTAVIKRGKQTKKLRIKGGCAA